MIVRHDQGQAISRLVRCADGKDLVRAMLLTSTRARPRAPVDVLSDYDVGLVLEAIRRFFEPRFWLEDCG